jgi:tetratricopeptide (TPR) repeat protein
MIWLLALQLAISPQQSYENAKQYLAQMKLPQAEQEIEAALDGDPYFVPALVLKARLALFVGRPDLAKRCLIAAVTDDPSSEEAQFFLGVFYYVQNDFKLAVQPLQRASSLSSKDPMPPFYLALTQEALGNAPDALAFYQQAENLSPEKTGQTSAILVAYGRFLYSSGKYEESIDKEQRAVEANDKSRDAHYELAKGLDREGDHKRAALEGERALTLPNLGTSSTSDAQIHFLLGNAYLRLNQYDLAQAHLAKFRAATQTTKR